MGLATFKGGIHPYEGKELLVPGAQYPEYDKCQTQLDIIDYFLCLSI